MARLAPDEIYSLFDKFVTGFIINKNFCLLADSSEYTKDYVKNSLEEVIKCFANNSIDSNSNSEEDETNNFKQRLKEQFKGNEQAKLCFSHIDWLWAFAASDMKGGTKNSFPFNDLKECQVCPEFRMEDNMGIGSANPRLQKYKEIKLLIYIIQSLWNDNDIKDVESVKEKIVSLINNGIKEQDDDDLKEKLPIKNALLHLCAPEEYEPIFSHNHKDSICNAFEWILKAEESEKKAEEDEKKAEESEKKAEEDEKKAEEDGKKAEESEKKVEETEKMPENDQKLRAIREKLCDIYGFTKGFSFYDDGIRELWQIDDKKVDNLDEVQLLEYKKAMVLYGPPGTSKTYSAMSLAKLLVARGMVRLVANDKSSESIDNKKIEEIKGNLGTLLSKNKDEVKNVLSQYVDRLQMHINYNYEDFVAGQVIENNKVVTKKGYIFDAIEKAGKSNGVPYVVILDEINRTDISRVFGEVFSAMEYRGENIKLPLKEKNGSAITLCIPDNLYFIGTMNEIDFSLERIDFALRRRFVWVLKTFEESRLKSILLEKLPNESTTQIDDYCKQCKDLNAIISDSELGDNYVIGHAFFADIQKIINQFQRSKRWDKPKQVLWQISIFPTLEAYCGAMDKNKQNEIIKNCAEAFGFEYKDGLVSLKQTSAPQNPK